MTRGDPIGRRIAHYRRAAGIRSTEELAARIGNPRITDSVLRNIETGRKADVTVSQLVDIAWALRVPLTVLLVPMERPLDPVDLPNVSAGVQSLTAGQFDAWASALGAEPATEPTQPMTPVGLVGTVRDILWHLRYLDRLEGEDQERQGFAEMPNLPASLRLRMAHDDRAGFRRIVERRIDEDCAALERAGVDTSWVPRPWRSGDA